MLGQGEFQGWEVSIKTPDYRQLREFQPEYVGVTEELGGRSECFLEVADEEFHFEFRRPTQGNIDYDVRATIFINGERIVNNTIFRNTYIKRQESFYHEVDGRRLNSRFSFAKITTTDDPSAQVPDKEALCALGQIKVEMWVGESSAPQPIINTGRDPSHPQMPSNTVHERTKKATLSHTVIPGGSIVDEKFTPKTFRRFRPFNVTPDYVFTFKYRSRELLMAEEIIPRPLTPPLDVNLPDRKPKHEPSPRTKPEIGFHVPRRYTPDPEIVHVSNEDIEVEHLLLGQQSRRRQRPAREESPEVVAAKRARGRQKGSSRADAIDLTDD